MMNLFIKKNIKCALLVALSGLVMACGDGSNNAGGDSGAGENDFFYLPNGPITRESGSGNAECASDGDCDDLQSCVVGRCIANAPDSNLEPAKTTCLINFHCTQKFGNDYQCEENKCIKKTGSGSSGSGSSGSGSGTGGGGSKSKKKKTSPKEDVAPEDGDPKESGNGESGGSDGNNAGTLIFTPVVFPDADVWMSIAKIFSFYQKLETSENQKGPTIGALDKSTGPVCVPVLGKTCDDVDEPLNIQEFGSGCLPGWRILGFRVHYNSYGVTRVFPRCFNDKTGELVLMGAQTNFPDSYVEDNCEEAVAGLRVRSMYHPIHKHYFITTIQLLCGDLKEDFTITHDELREDHYGECLGKEHESGEIVNPDPAYNSAKYDCTKKGMVYNEEGQIIKMGDDGKAYYAGSEYIGPMPDQAWTHVSQSQNFLLEQNQFIRGFHGSLRNGYVMTIGASYQEVDLP